MNAANIRFYEKQGLLDLGERTDNRYRSYTDSDIHQLKFIRLCRAMDMSLDEVKTLLNLDVSGKADCAAANAALDDHIAHVGERLAELQALQQNLINLRDGCDGSGPQCRIMQALHARAEHLPPKASRARAHRHV